MLKSYFDRSGQEQDDFLTLSGVAAGDDIWTDIDRGWKRILHNRKPEAEYMHMTEAVPLREGFSRAKGWDGAKVEVLISDLIVYLSSVDNKKYCQFACTVHMDAYRKLQAKGYRMESPVDLCNTSCVDRVMAWYLREYKGLDLSARYYFDQNEPFEPAFKAKWNSETHRDRQTGGYSVWSHIEHVGSAVMQKTPGLQIADMQAWANNRERIMPMQRYTHLAPVIRFVLSPKTIFWDEANLRQRFKPLIYSS